MRFNVLGMVFGVASAIPFGLLFEDFVAGSILGAGIGVSLGFALASCSDPCSSRPCAWA